MSNGNNSLGPDPNEIGYDECIGDSSSSSSSSSSGSGTKCNLDITNNVWVEGVVDPANGKRGICMLDSMSYAQVVYVLQHDPKARVDLPRVTSDPELLEMLATIPLLDSGPTLEAKLRRQSARTGLPYYSVFRGNPPNAQQHPKKKT